MVKLNANNAACGLNTNPGVIKYQEGHAGATFTAVLTALWLFAHVGVAGAAPQIVNNPGDTNTPTTLRYALGQVLAGEGITFNVGSSNTITLASNLPTLSLNNLTIDGANGAAPEIIIDGANLYRPFTLAASANNLTLKNLTIQNGLTSGSGGAFNIDGSLTLVLDGTTTFRHNRATSVAVGSGGGAIYARGALHITGPVVFGGSAPADGNTAPMGGALFFTTGSHTLTLDGTTEFINNTAPASGGAIFFHGTAAQNIVNALPLTFKSNSSGGGGAIYTFGPLTISGPVTFGGATAAEGNTASNGGAILFDLSTALNLGGSAVFNNNAVTGRGGALYVNVTQPLVINNGTNSLTFINNKALGGVGFGGAIYSVPTLTITGPVTFGGVGAGNNANFGGALRMGTLATGLNLNGPATFVANRAEMRGGAIDFLAATTATLSAPTEFRDNTVTSGTGGALHFNAGGALIANDNVTFQGNTASGEPNAIFVVGNSFNLGVAAGKTIAFYDPIASDTATPGRVIQINPNAADTGLILFDTHASNMYGNTTVSHGTVRLSNGAVYGVVANPGTFTFGGGATLRADVNGNAIRANNFNMGAGGSLAFDLTGAVAANQPGATTNLTMTKGASGAFSGAAIGSGPVALSLSTGLDSGFYNLVSAPGAAITDTGALTWSATATSDQDRRVTSSMTLFADNANDRLQLNVGAMSNTTLIWTNAENNSIWEDFSDESSPRNWTNNPGGAPTVTQFYNGDDVIFDSTAANKNVNIAPNGVALNTMAVTDGNYTFNLSANELQPAITAADFVNLGNATLNINGYLPDQSSPFNAPKNLVTLISAAGPGGITNFNPALVTIAGQPTVDFLSANMRLENSDKDLIVETVLSWYSDEVSRPAHGDFTLDGMQVFTLGAPLADTAGNLSPAWDGRSLTKMGEGTLILAGTNTYTGETTIAGGGLTVTGTLGGGAYAGAVVNSGTLLFNQTADQTLSGVISGPGTLEQAGPGKLTLSGAGTYTGDTILSGGTLEVTGTLGPVAGGVATADTLRVVGQGGTMLAPTTQVFNQVYLAGGSTVTAPTPLNFNSLHVQGREAVYDGRLNAAGKPLFFDLPAGVASGQTIFRVTGPANVSGAPVHVNDDNGRVTMDVRQGVTLLDAPAGLTATNMQETVRTTQGDIYFLQITSTALLLVLQHISPQTPAYERLRSYSEGRLASLAFVSQGGDLVLNQGLASAMADTQGPGWKVSMFGAGSGGQNRYNTGSHVDVDGFSTLLGVALGNEAGPGRATVGVFFEAGWGSYSSFNSFSNYIPVNGDGNVDYYGGGILGRYDVQQGSLAGMYAEASARLGRVSADFDTEDIKYPSGDAAFDSASMYYGAHAGLGYQLSLTEKTTLDLSGKVIWTRQDGDRVDVHGDKVSFDTANSLRTRLGGRLSYAATHYLAPYLGAYWEHEFDGDQDSSINSVSIHTPTLRGDTGVGEFGLRLSPLRGRSLYVDLGVQGYTGVREGVTGSLQVKYEF